VMHVSPVKCESSLAAASLVTAVISEDEVSCWMEIGQTQKCEEPIFEVHIVSAGENYCLNEITLSLWC